VRVVAPASPFSEEALQAGVEVLEGWGLKVRIRKDIFDKRAYLAGTPGRRAAELHEAFDDPECRAVIAVRGGYGVTTMLPLLDPERLRADPKILVGCSDLTALLNWAVAEGVTAIHGPMVVALGRRDDEAGAERLRALLFGGKPAVLTSAMEDAYAWCIAPGVARGRSVGGSLSLLAAACGTPYQLDTQGCVLFLEDVGERPYRIDRLLMQLLQAGLFDGVAGIVFGDMVGCDEPERDDTTWQGAVDRVLRPLAIPVLAGVPFGHARPNLAIPLGTDVQIDTAAGTVTFREAPLA
jgi:muramoyltetrapeptide carboxypeptidase